MKYNSIKDMIGKTYSRYDGWSGSNDNFVIENASYFGDNDLKLEGTLLNYFGDKVPGATRSAVVLSHNASRIMQGGHYEWTETIDHCNIRNKVSIY